MNTIKKIVEDAIKKGAEEIHITAGAPISYRIEDEIHYESDVTVTPEYVESLIEEGIPTDQQKKLKKNNKALFSYNLESLGRLRMSISKQRGTYTISIHVHSPLESLLKTAVIPEAIKSMYKIKSGLIILTGGANSGRSTSAMTIMNDINENRRCHVATVERPIEYLHKHSKSIVRQREVGIDTKSYSEGFEDALNDGADVIFLDALGDVELLKNVIQAADSGRLILLIMNAPDATSTIQKIINSFDQSERYYLKYQFASALKAIVAHKMLYRNDIRKPIYEILIGNRAVKRLIEEDKIRDINKVIDAHGALGMVSMQVALDKAQKERIS